MRWIIVSFLLFLTMTGVVAEQVPDNKMPELPVPEPLLSQVPEQEKEETWWEKRDQRSDIYYPHKVHYEVMEEEGDSCLLCHAFQKNDEHDETRRKPLNTIANEPLEAICHDCHVDELRGPWRCDLCHDDPKKIWPADHNSGYIQNHQEDSKQGTAICETCHLDRKFCTDCHFRRDTLNRSYHPLNYINRHGLESRMMPANCSQCHNSFYCRDCHNQ